MENEKQINSKSPVLCNLQDYSALLHVQSRQFYTTISYPKKEKKIIIKSKAVPQMQQYNCRQKKRNTKQKLLTVPICPQSLFVLSTSQMTLKPLFHQQQSICGFHLTVIFVSFTVHATQVEFTWNYIWSSITSRDLFLT